MGGQRCSEPRRAGPLVCGKLDLLQWSCSNLRLNRIRHNHSQLLDGLIPAVYIHAGRYKLVILKVEENSREILWSSSDSLANVCIIIHVSLACFKGQLLESCKNRNILNGKGHIKNLPFHNGIICLRCIYNVKCIYLNTLLANGQKVRFLCSKRVCYSDPTISLLFPQTERKRFQIAFLCPFCPSFQHCGPVAWAGLWATLLF